MSDPKETLAARQIAAIGLGKDPSMIRSRTPTSQSSNPTQAEREVAKLALEKGRPAVVNPASSFDDQLRAIMNDEREAPAARQIAAIALGKDPKTLGFASAPAQSSNPAGAPGQTASPPPAQRPTYTFLATPSGTVRISENGKLVATTTPEFAAQYGYQIPKVSASSPVTSVTGGASAVTPGLTGTPTPTSPSTTALLGKFFSQGDGNTFTSSKQIAIPQNNAHGLWATIGKASAINNQALDSSAGQTLVDTLASAGGAVAPKWANTINDVGQLATAAKYLKQGDYLSLAQQGVEMGTEKTGEALGAALVPENPVLGRAVGGASVQAIIDVDKFYIAPVAADWLVKTFPEVFVPPSIAQPIQIDPFTQKPIPPN
jgi:hypothetical protein